MDYLVIPGKCLGTWLGTGKTPAVLLGVVMSLLVLVSCSKSPDQARQAVQRAEAGAQQPFRALPRKANSSATRSPRNPSSGTSADVVDAPAVAAGKEELAPSLPKGNGPAEDESPAELSANKSLATAALPTVALQPALEASSDNPAPRQDERVQQPLGSTSIRKLEGTHLTLYTDVPAAPEVDELPRVFDLAVEPWCKYFHVNRKNVASWKMTGYLMDQRERFVSAGMLPADLPPFLNGYQRGGDLWVYEQPSAYYRRHLLLHEGTHAFMQWQLKGTGPPWYMEGMAELMGTHRWKDGVLQLAYFPHDRQEVDHWGRIKMIETEYTQGRGMSLDQIAAYGPTAHLKNEPYGWCWGATAFLDGHPDYSRRFRQLVGHVRDSPPDFATFFQRMYSGDRRQLDEQWQLFVANLEYGYDLQREAIVYEPVVSRSGETVTATVRADRGWQSTGIQVHAGDTYLLQAAGRYQIGEVPKIWWCEPGGVTIRYYHGLPLGMLVAGVSDQTQPLAGVTPLAHPQPIGLHRDIEFPQSGTLFLRINDAPSQLADNAGQLTVEIRPEHR